MDLEYLADQIVQSYLAKARVIWALDLPMPKISLDLRGRVAGQAWYTDWKIRLNRVLFRENVDYFVGHTIGHEVAHLIACRLHGLQVKAHGDEWKRIMLRLGLEPKRCHCLDVTPAVTRRKFLYICSCQKHTVGAARHKRIGWGKKYICKKCKKTLAFLREV